ncbi:MAG TPA: hypothetical protein VE008_10430 [Burkholderiales bacterium]|nr:hypothetical protein [Burkholderiales bacterium]
MLTYDSNITRSQDTPLPQWTESLMAGAAYQESTADVNARFLGQVERRHYLEGAFKDDNTIYVDGSVLWSIVPQRLNWIAEDYGREVRLDITAPDTPTNRTTVNSFSTGPDTNFRLSSTDFAQFGARYGRYDITGPGDYYRYEGYARLGHQFSPFTTLSLNYVPVLAYLDPTTSPYSTVLREDYFVHYDSHSIANSLVLEAGTTHLTREGGTPLNGRLLRGSYARTMTSTSSLRLLYSENYSDTYTDLLGQVRSVMTPAEQAPLAPLPGTVATTQDPNLYFSRRGDVNYVEQGDRLGYSVRGYYRSVDYLTLPQDYYERGGLFDWSWQFAGETRVGGQVVYIRRTFTSFFQEDVERLATLGATYRFTPNITFTLTGAKQDRETTAATGAFKDWRVTFLVGYSTGALFPVQSRR